MSLEKAIEDNTAAIRELITIWRGANAAAVTNAENAKPQRADQAKAKAITEPVTREALKPMLLSAIRAKGEPAVSKIMGKYGAAKLSQVSDENLDKLYTDLKALA